MTRDADPLAALAALCAEVEALSAKATPGPWRADMGFVVDPRDVFVAEVMLDTLPDSNDTKFIARARALLPTLARVARAVVKTLEHDGCRYQEDTYNCLESHVIEALARALSDAGPKDDKEGK